MVNNLLKVTHWMLFPGKDTVWPEPASGGPSFSLPCTPATLGLSVGEVSSCPPVASSGSLFLFLQRLWAWMHMLSESTKDSPLLIQLYSLGGLEDFCSWSLFSKVMAISKPMQTTLPIACQHLRSLTSVISSFTLPVPEASLLLPKSASSPSWPDYVCPLPS